MPGIPWANLPAQPPAGAPSEREWSVARRVFLAHVPPAGGTRSYLDPDPPCRCGAQWPCLWRQMAQDSIWAAYGRVLGMIGESVSPTRDREWADWWRAMAVPRDGEGRPRLAVSLRPSAPDSSGAHPAPEQSPGKSTGPKQH